jgi:hypothetical protein
VRIPKGSTCRVSVPVANDSQSKVTLSLGQVLGSLKPVKSVVALCNPKVRTVNSAVVASSQDCSTQDSNTPKEWDPDIPLDDQLLTHDQIKKVRQMFRE